MFWCGFAGVWVWVCRCRCVGVWVLVWTCASPSHSHTPLDPAHAHTSLSRNRSPLTSTRSIALALTTSVPRLIHSRVSHIPLCASLSVAAPALRRHPHTLSLSFLLSPSLTLSSLYLCCTRAQAHTQHTAHGTHAHGTQHSIQHKAHTPDKARTTDTHAHTHTQTERENALIRLSQLSLSNFRGKDSTCLRAIYSV